MGQARSPGLTVGTVPNAQRVSLALVPPTFFLSWWEDKPTRRNGHQSFGDRDD